MRWLEITRQVSIKKWSEWNAIPKQPARERGPDELRLPLARDAGKQRHEERRHKKYVGHYADAHEQKLREVLQKPDDEEQRHFAFAPLPVKTSTL